MAAFAKLVKDGKGDSKLLETYFFLFLPKTNDENQFAKLLEQSKKQQIIIFRHTLVAHMKQNVGHIINMKKKEDT